MATTMPALIVNGDVVGYYPPNASSIEFNNTSTTLSSTNIQDAIIELNNNKVNKSGDTMSGNLSIQKSLDSDVFLNVKDTTNNKQISFGFGTSGKRGIYDYSIDNWIFHMNGTDAYVNNTKVPYNGGELALKSDLANKVTYASAWVNVNDDKSFDIGDYAIILIGHPYEGNFGVYLVMGGYTTGSYASTATLHASSTVTDINKTNYNTVRVSVNTNMYVTVMGVNVSLATS
jgi:hypothetical protein